MGAEVSILVFQALRDAEALVRTGASSRSPASVSLVQAALRDSGFVDPACLKDKVNSNHTAMLPMLQVPKRSRSVGSLAQATSGEIGGGAWGAAAMQGSSPPALPKNRALPCGARSGLRGSASPHRNGIRGLVTQQPALRTLRLRAEKAELRQREL